MINRHSSFECFFRGIAQLVEQRSPKPRAEGSNPSAPAIDYPENPEKSGFFVTFLRERFLGDRG